jgi:hypothetical protein
MYFNPPINGASTNELDLSYECQGLITDFVFRTTLEHYARLAMPIYAIYIPDKRKYDIYRWIPIHIVDNTLIVENPEINRRVRILNAEDLEGETCGKIYCHAVGSFKMHHYLNLPNLNYEDAQIEFGEKYWLHMKIG